MLTDAIIQKGLRLDDVERQNIRGRIVYTDNPFLQHALTHYAAALREVVRLREALETIADMSELHPNILHGETRSRECQRIAREALEADNG